MKKLLVILFVLTCLTGFSQISVAINGEDAADGQVFTFNETGPDADMVFVVTNTGGEDTYTQLTVMEIENNHNGNDLQFCWDLCYIHISAGDVYPSAPEMLTPGGSTAPVGNHFENLYEGDTPGEPVIYVFRFEEVDADGLIVGNTITITYKYDPNAAVVDETALPVRLYPTVVHDSFTVNCEKALSGTVTDTNGKAVKRFTASAGNNIIRTHDITGAGIYFVTLSDDKGHSVTKKIIIR